MNAPLKVEVQYACDKAGVPSSGHFQRWAREVLTGQGRGSGELVIRLVDTAEGAELNKTYRGKSGPTNVLSFPFEAPAGVPVDHCGDLVICVPVVLREAEEQNKPTAAHFAHMVVHGTLHLLGLDHRDDSEARTMEALEITLMGRLGYPNPYEN